MDDDNTKRMIQEHTHNIGVEIRLLGPITVEDTGRLTALLDDIGVAYSFRSEAWPWKPPDGRTTRFEQWRWNIGMGEYQRSLDGENWVGVPEALVPPSILAKVVRGPSEQMLAEEFNTDE